jgi:preprotein translocase subunit YajC
MDGSVGPLVPFQQGNSQVLISEAFAQTGPAAAGGDAFGSMNLVLIAVMVAVMYFIVLRPQMKRQKELKALIDGLAKGDEVVIAGGLLGRVVKLGETYLSVEIASNVEIQVQRQAVVQVLPKGTYKAA